MSKTWAEFHHYQKQRKWGWEGGGREGGRAGSLLLCLCVLFFHPSLATAPHFSECPKGQRATEGLEKG